ncbi:MAG: methylamine utilization protein MauE, partial [Deltaproteobacteria bacterium]|nr:methylamine utilization protein MauE [Deltaproteobacteria bacterium]
VAVGVLCLYSLAIGINLARGRRDIDCGCAGPLARQTLHEMLVARNLVYAALALGAAAPMSLRAFGWLDGLTIGFGVVALFALAVAIDGLAAMAARTTTSGAHT